MSYTNLNFNPVDGYQRVSYCRTATMRRIRDEGDNDAGDGLVICKNLVLGCKPEPTDDFRPFVFEPTWCVYIKALDNVDMGQYVKQVTFRMSPRLPLRLHVADSSPFEITEVLSTDFPVELQVDYLDPNMSPTIYVYKPNDVFDGKYNVDLRMNFQGHERSDKMFFMNPSTTMQLALTTPMPSPAEAARKKLQLQAALSTAIFTKRHKTTANAEEPDVTSTDLIAGALGSPSAPRPIFNVRVPSLVEDSAEKL